MCLYTYLFYTTLLLKLIVHLIQTLSDFEQDIIDAVIDPWHDRLRSHVHAGGKDFKHML